MNIKIMEKCCNCGANITHRADRLAVCTCGHTIALTQNDEYAVCNYNNDKISSIAIYMRGLLIKVLSDPDEIVLHLIDYPIKDDREVYHNALGASVKEFEDYTANEMILHILHMQNSEVYQMLFAKGFFKVCRAVINIGREFMNFESNEECNRLDKLGDYITKQMSYQQLYNGLVCCIKGVEIKHCLILNELELNPSYLSLFKSFDSEFDVSLVEVFTDLKKIYKMGLRGTKAISLIMDYYRMRQDLQFFFGMDFAHEKEFEKRYIKTKRKYVEYLDSGRLGTAYYKMLFNEEYPSIVYYDLKVKRIGAKEIDHINSKYLKIPKVLDEPIIAVYDSDGAPISYVLYEHGKINIVGVNNDTIKTAINHYLDYIKYGD